MNRKVGGLGHDPKTEPVEAQVGKKNVYCFEDQTVAEAKQIMCDAKVAEVPVVTREKLLVGTTNLEAIAQGESGSRHSRQNNSGQDATDATEAQP
jgi:Mg/Co/Ni transporter MgtE